MRGKDIALIYPGHIKNGVVVLNESTDLPEGVAMRVELPERADDTTQRSANGATLAQKLLSHAGKAQDLPADASSNLDHYLYGTPKR